jgi:hypothetical protein
MEAKLKFNLDDPDDNMSFKQCVAAPSMAMFIWELVFNTKKRCYHILEASPEGVDAIEIVYNEIYEMLENEHIDIDTLIV